MSDCHYAIAIMWREKCPWGAPTRYFPMKVENGFLKTHDLGIAEREFEHIVKNLPELFFRLIQSCKLPQKSDPIGVMLVSMSDSGMEIIRRY